MLWEMDAWMEAHMGAGRGGGGDGEGSGDHGSSGDNCGGMVAKL